MGVPGSLVVSEAQHRFRAGCKAPPAAEARPLGGIEISFCDRLLSTQSRRSDTIREVGRLSFRTKNVDLHKLSAVRSKSKVTFGHRFPVPPVPFVFKIYSQGLFVSTNPGYSPGSFSNMVSF